MTSNLSTPAHPAAMVAELTQQEQQTNNTPTSPPTRPSPIITTPRLIIRPLYPPDAPELVKACEPASITKYMTLAFAYPYTLSHAETWISMNLAPPINHFTICEADKPDVPIGGVGIKPGADVQAHTGEVGYWVREEVQGRGYATEALRAIVEWGFGKVEGGREYKRLWAGVFAENKASMHILEKVGFVQEGIQKGHIEKHGVVMDAHLFGLAKADWEKQTSGT